MVASGRTYAERDYQFADGLGNRIVVNNDTAQKLMPHKPLVPLHPIVCPGMASSVPLSRARFQEKARTTTRLVEIAEKGRTNCDPSDDTK